MAIIGAGFSGPILAANIAEKGVNPKTRDQLKVVLIEAGPYLKGTPKPGYGSPLRRLRFSNLGGADPAFHWQDRGARIVGGSSLHWQASALLPFPIDYLHWQKETGVDWTEENFREAVEEIRREFNIHEYPEAVNTRGNKLFYEVAKQMGYDPHRQIGARRNCIYCGYCLTFVMCKYDSRSSTLASYIPKAEKYGVDILADTVVEKILIDVKGKRGVARGLICRGKTSTYQLNADHIILACGHRNTPRLLMSSGYGPPEWASNPITVVNSNIGKHIDGHPSTPGISALFDEPLGDGEMRSVRGYFMIHDVRADGEGRLLLRSEFGAGKIPEAAALNVFAPEFGREHKKFMREKGIFRTGSLDPTVAKPSGRWSIDPNGKLVYGGNHSLTIRRAREGLAIAHEILTKMGARKITSINIPVTIHSGTRGSRMVGACRAGIDPQISVVNPYFESHDVDNLFICDNSVIPRVTTGPTGIPLAVVAVFAAERIVERHFKG
ncbi:GMC family oxidoreductase [Acidobacteria bacterium AH-259-D05]|nr:GMC family oxidoreductase [Acidobacteria bacterium AH-259-D05]